MMEETRVPADESYDYDSSEFDEQNFDRPKERWAPLGAAMASPPPTDTEQNHVNENEYLLKLEEEQEQLNSSLLALTSHFAQVQFRLKQIVSSEDEDKETLLKELEEFAFKGIPDVRGCRTQDATILEESSEKEHEFKITEQREKQQELIKQLKSQLEDLESYAYETGGAEELPTNTVLEKQKVIIDQLRQKLNLELDDFAKLSTEDLRQVVDQAIGQIVNPAKVKEKLVDQLKTQIVDLERFIQFLQGESTDPGPLGSKCTCPVHHTKNDESDVATDCCVPHPHRPRLKDGKESKKLRDSTLSIMKQALTLLQIFAVSQFGCGGREFRKNLLKRTPKGNHWGDLRARLEVAIDKVIETSKNQDHPLDSDYTSDSEDTSPPCTSVPSTVLVHKSWPPLLPGEQMPMSSQPVEQTWATPDDTENRQYPGSFSYELQDGHDSAPVIQCNQALTTAVRKELTIALRDLLQHGLMEVGQSSSLVPWGCFPKRSAAAASKSSMMHAWDLIIKFYEMKHGREYNDSPARRLSMAFDLEMVGGKAITSKQTLLSAIDSILTSHQPLKRSEDAMLKAFVCLALNQKKLVSWLRLILRTNSLIEFYYQPWSYVVKTGFDDALRSLDKLCKVDFNLPVDLAVRQIHNIRDAF